MSRGSRNPIWFVLGAARRVVEFVLPGDVGGNGERPSEAVAPGAGVPYEEWTKVELYGRAQDLDVPGRSKMSKSELIEALRSR